MVVVYSIQDSALANVNICLQMLTPGDNFGTVVGENPTPYEDLALWAVNGLSIVCWDIHRIFLDSSQRGKKFKIEK